MTPATPLRKGSGGDARREWTSGRDFHRDDGPAVEYDNGAKVWWRHGRPLRMESSGGRTLWEAPGPPGEDDA